MGTPLLQALGLQGHAPVPPSRGRGWQSVCATVHRLLREEGCAVRLRSPTAMAEALGIGHTRPRTWIQLFGNFTAKDLAEAATRHAERGRDAFCSWNARWMRQLATTQADLKRLTIQRRLLQ